MKKVIHVNQAVIKTNRKTGNRCPVLTTKTYKDNLYGHEVDILDKDGNVIASVIYRPDKPLSCGAHVWIETEAKVVVRSIDGSSVSGSGSSSSRCLD